MKGPGKFQVEERRRLGVNSTGVRNWSWLSFYQTFRRLSLPWTTWTLNLILIPAIHVLVL